MKKVIKCMKIVWNKDFIRMSVNIVDVMFQEPDPINKMIIHQGRQDQDTLVVHTDSTNLIKRNGVDVCMTKPILKSIFCQETRKSHFEVIENSKRFRNFTEG